MRELVGARGFEPPTPRSRTDVPHAKSLGQTETRSHADVGIGRLRFRRAFSLGREPSKAMEAQVMAERVGFVPVDHSSFNNLGLNSIARNSKNTQNLGSRYKTGTVNCGRETH